MKGIKKVLTYLAESNLILTTAESCTAGRIINLLAKYSGAGASLDIGYVVYSKEAKKRVLGVKQTTIAQFTLTSEEVATEMAQGALLHSDANVAVSTTGVAGPDPMDGIPPGTICFAWIFKISKENQLFKETKHFRGTRTQVLNKAAEYALIQIPKLHRRIQQ